MLSKIYTSSIHGIDGSIITVECDVAGGIASFLLVGLADAAVRESRDRISAALKNNGFSMPAAKVTVNLAPADIRKEGTVFDLPISVGILAASGQIHPRVKLGAYIMLGELSLDGCLKGVKGVLPMVASAAGDGFLNFIVPRSNACEALLVAKGNVYAADTLKDVIGHICGSEPLEVFKDDISKYIQAKSKNGADMSDVKGQRQVKRAMEIAAAGGHNMLMVGPPGSGKTMLAKRFATILPDMHHEESLEVTKIYSVSGLLKPDAPFITQRPFRSPHHTVSSAALIGGGRIPKPGEVSLAHGGVLFLDEFAEFSKMSLEALRQPIEDHVVSISRVSASMTYPASFMLLASMNPCPCGYHNDTAHKCRCSPVIIERYMQKISGPIIDRIDIITQVNVENYENLTQQGAPADSSADIRARITKARAFQKQRFDNEGIFFNAQLSVRQIDQYCKLGAQERTLMESAFKRYNMSARTFHRVLKLARTIADLGFCENIGPTHLSEALQYRGLDNNYFR